MATTELFKHISPWHRLSVTLTCLLDRNVIMMRFAITLITSDQFMVTTTGLNVHEG